MQSIDKIQKSLIELEHLIPKQDILVEKVSKGSVYRHSDHVLVATKKMLQSLKPNEHPIKKFNPIFTLVLWMNWMPRGVGKTPV